jgi:hypothetical protein
MPQASPPQADVGTRVVEMRDPRFQHRSEMTLMKWNEEVQAFAAQRPAETIAHGIRLWLR